MRRLLEREGLLDDRVRSPGCSATADDVAARLRSGDASSCPTPQPLALFEHVYSTDAPAHRRATRAVRRVPRRLRTASRRHCHDHHDALARRRTQRRAATRTRTRPKVVIMGEDVGTPRRRLPGHRHAAEGFRRQPGHRHPAGRIRHRRNRVRHGAARLSAGLRDPVRRVRLPRVRPDRLAGREDPLPHPGPGQRADHHPDPVRWRNRFGRAPFRIAGGVFRTHRGTAGGDPEQPGRRVCNDPAGVSLDDPVVFLEPKRRYWDKAEVDLDAPTGLSAAPGAGGAAGRGRHRRRVRLHGGDRPRGRGCGRRARGIRWR